MKAGNSRKHIAALDGMRGLAVFLVFMSHASGRQMFLAPWLDFHGIGQVGVYLFFVLSGFLLTKNLLNGQKSEQYLARRFFRIAPLYFAVLVGVTLYQVAGYYSPHYLHIKGGGTDVLLHFLFLKGDGIFWTIAAEFAFYLLLPAVLLAINRFGWKWLAVLSVAYFLWFVCIQMLGVPLVPLKFIFIEHNTQFIDVFVCGILGAYVRHILPKKVVAILFWGLILLTLLCVSKNFFGVGRLWFSLRWVSILYGVIFSLAVVSAMQGNRWLVAPLENKIMVFMGITGFGWYLLHLPVMQEVNYYFEGNSNVQRFLISGLAISILSSITFLLIERPGIRLGRKIESSLFKNM